MRLKAKDPMLISLIGEFMKVYLPSVENAMRIRLHPTNTASTCIWII